MNSTSSPAPASRFLLSRATWVVAVIGLLAMGSGAACAFDSGESSRAPTLATFERQGFVETVITVDGREARVIGYRTPSETRISVDLPGGLTMLTQATLRVDGKRLVPGSSSSDGQVTTTVFPTTKLDAAVEFELGAIAKFEGEPSFITVAMKDVLKAADGDAEFPIPAIAVVAGDASRVISGEQGKYGSSSGSPRRWVGIEVVGNWNGGPHDFAPQILDGKGVELQRAHMMSSYRKDANGAVSEGTTKIAAFTTNDSDLSQLTLVLSPSTVPDGETYSVQLQPE